MAQADPLSALDRLDIMDLIACYARTLDSGDLDGYANNFAPDGVLFEKHQGRAAIHEYVGQLMKEGRAGPLPNGDVAFRHFVGFPTIDGDSSGVTVHSYLLWINMGTNAPIQAAAEYIDHCAKLDGRWYFQSRKLNSLAGTPPSGQPVIVQ